MTPVECTPKYFWYEWNGTDLADVIALGYTGASINPDQTLRLPSGMGPEITVQIGGGFSAGQGVNSVFKTAAEFAEQYKLT